MVQFEITRAGPLTRGAAGGSAVNNGGLFYRAAGARSMSWVTSTTPRFVT
jgi:hypothetical protein